MRGPSRPRRGDELRDIIIIEDGSVLIEDDKILRVGPTRQVENVAAAKTHPATANAEIPDSSVPTVQPSATIEPQPCSTPPSTAVIVFRTVRPEI